MTTSRGVVLVLAIAAFAYAAILRIGEWQSRKAGSGPSDRDNALPGTRERMGAFVLVVMLLLIAAAAAAVHDKVAPP